MTQIIKNRDGTLTIGKQQRVDPIFQENHEYSKDNPFGTGKKLHKVASIPTVLFDKWCKEWKCTMHQMMTDPEIKLKLYRRLNSNDWQKLRTDDQRKL